MDIKIYDNSNQLNYYKADEKGAGSVCNSIEELVNKKVTDIVNKLIKLGLSDEQIVSATGLTPEAVHDLRCRLN